MSLQTQLVLGRLGPDEAVDWNRSLKRQIAQIWAATGQRTPQPVGEQIGGYRTSSAS